MNTKQIIIIIGTLILVTGLLIIGGGQNANDTNGFSTDDTSLDSNDGTVEVDGEDSELDVDSNADIIDTQLDYSETDYYRTTLVNQSFNYIQVMEKQIPLEIKQIDLNYSIGAKMTPEYLVIHETNNYAAGADANAHYRYWNTNPDAQASTHFVVDNNEIYQMLELDQIAWHVGDNDGHSDITNYNSVGIEIAVNSDGDYDQARQNTISLTINLMNELEMDISQLKRHYDASGKWCPTNMLDEPDLWTDFVSQVEAGLNQ